MSLEADMNLSMCSYSSLCASPLKRFIYCKLCFILFKMKFALSHFEYLPTIKFDCEYQKQQLSPIGDLKNLTNMIKLFVLKIFKI